MTLPAENCPVCDSPSTSLFLDRPSVPVHQNLLMASPEEASQIKRGRLAMHVCSTCGFVFNRAFDDRLMSYNQNYENTQVHSPAFNEYVDQLVGTVLRDSGMRGATIVEVGCGKGDFIKRLLRTDPRARGYGFDPSYLGPDVVLDGRLKFEKRFYDASSADLKADIVICRHVIEHITRPNEIVRAVRSAVESNPEAHVFFETPSVDWILENEVTWDFFYEHCSLFTAASLSTLFTRNRFHVESVRHVFGEQYLWLHARPAAVTPQVTLQPGTTPENARRFKDVEARRNRVWRELIQAESARGPLVVWGAGAKAVTFANLVDPDHRWIEAIVDVNPSKQGKYLAGSQHPIIAPDSLSELQPACVLVLNPNYRDEISQRLSSLGLSTEIIDLMHDGVLSESGQLEAPTI
ncbi:MULTISPECIES: class I SAM-dependent methyltransferase [unclassified Schlesneria]|uniref:class I SAM-dependent methyltransferase n=1 Tax=unclassified Schlesneria TaxID=2762017 RepID=UPI002EEC3B82